MSFTYFILATENEIKKLKTVDDVFNHIENINPMFGGELLTLESITNLCQIFLKGLRGFPIQTKYYLNDCSKFYVLNSEFCRKVASTERNEILNASVPWSEGKPWKDIEYNQMDLAGMIIDFVALCKQTNNEKHLYFLISNET